MQIYCHDETNKLHSNQLKLVQDLLSFAATVERVPRHAEVSVIFVNNMDIQEINRTYRGIDRPTDVISFALEEQSEEEIQIVDKDIPFILGEIIISVDKIEEQANDYDHSFKRELGFLVVHGFLHLLGYDHMNKDDEQKMFRKQEVILSEFHLER